MSKSKYLVNREDDIAKIESILNSAQSGKGNFVLISAAPGAGKTTLAKQFIRKVNLRKNIYTVSCNCVYSKGYSAAFHPISELIEKFVDFENYLSNKTQGSNDSINLKRKIYLRAIQTLVENTPDIIDVLIPGAGLITKLGAPFIPDNVKDIYKQLILSRQKAKRKIGKTHNKDADNIAYQFYTFLKSLSKEATIIVFIDDLQWADTATINLINFLIGKIQSFRVLFIAAFRTTDIHIKIKNRRHPVASLRNEIIRIFGDIEINLDEKSESSKKRFIEKYITINFSPNKIGIQFVDTLFNHTEGNAFFVDELLYHLQDKQVLIRNNDGIWFLSNTVNFEELPKTVEAVIEERIESLTSDLREILEIGSVEGEQFTAQVIAQLKNIEQRKLLSKLRLELGKNHQFVKADTVERVGAALLYLYRFRHALFNSYIYDRLDQPERIILHKAVGEALERLYADENYKIAHQLTRHFNEALDFKRALKYSLITALTQIKQYALLDALKWSKRALNISNRIEDRKQIASYLLDIYRIIGDIYFIQSEYKKSIINFSKCIKVADTNDLKLRFYNCIGDCYERQGLYQLANKNYQKGMEFSSGPVDPFYIAKLQVSIAWLHNVKFEEEKGREIAKNALPTIKQKGSAREIARVYKVLALSYNPCGNWKKSIEYARQGKKLLKRLGDRIGEAECDSDLGLFYRNGGILKKAFEHNEACLSFFKEIGEQRKFAWAIGFKGLILRDFGQLKKALIFTKEGLKVAKKIDIDTTEKLCRWIGLIYIDIGNYAKAEKYLLKSLKLSKRVDHSHCVEPMNSLSFLYSKLNRLEEASILCNEAFSISKKKNIVSEQWKYHYIIGQISFKQRQYLDALNSYEKSLTIANTIRPRGAMELRISICNAYLLIEDAINSERYLKHAISEAKEKKYSLLLGIAFRLKGLLSALQNNEHLAIHSFERSLSLLQKVHANHEIAITLKEYATFLSDLDESKSKKFFDLAQGLFRKIDVNLN